MEMLGATLGAPTGLAPAVLLAYGVFIVVKELFAFAAVLYKTLLRPGKNLKKAYGEWAVVTGATDGIGKAMAFEMARKGMSVCLVARSEDKLKACKDECVALHPNVQVKTLVVDFGSFGLAASKRVAAELDALEVGVLVNNVGISYAFPQWFHELTDDEVQSMMTINLESVVWMTRAVLPGMLQRKRGAVVNMSSASARPPLPLLAVYASTKGYVENFTKAMAYEYAHKGISFQCQSPLYVATSIVFPNSKVPVEKRATLSTPSPKTYARYAVARIGHDVMVSPYWLHEIVLFVQARTSDDLAGRLLLSMHKGIRFHRKNKAKMEEKIAAYKKTK